jgi:ABC-type oligopeptide transport system substrate-binding subunit
MSPLPPGIFGHIEGKEGINPYVYDWDPERGRAVRKPIAYAKKLLAEAGYPGGRDAEGRPLTITFDNSWTGPAFTPLINWYIKRLKLIGIQLENRTTDYNRFREKVMKGNFQLLHWGWNADYPDPENFFFLLAGRNAKVDTQGENTANYKSAEFDRLFAKMENMNNTPERLGIIKEMNSTLQREAPWAWGYYLVSFGLYHSWVGNVKSNAMANNTMKYIRIDGPDRTKSRYAWNRPRYRPVAAVAIVLIAAALLAIVTRKNRRSG